MSMFGNSEQHRSSVTSHLHAVFRYREYALLEHGLSLTFHISWRWQPELSHAGVTQHSSLLSVNSSGSFRWLALRIKTLVMCWSYKTLSFLFLTLSQIAVRFYFLQQELLIFFLFSLLQRFLATKNNYTEIWTKFLCNDKKDTFTHTRRRINDNSGGYWRFVFAIFHRTDAERTFMIQCWEWLCLGAVCSINFSRKIISSTHTKPTTIGMADDAQCNYFDVLQSVDDAEDDEIYVTQHEKKYADMEKLCVFFSICCRLRFISSFHSSP